MEKNIVKEMDPYDLTTLLDNLKHTLDLSDIQNYFPIHETLDDFSNEKIFKSKYHVLELLENLNENYENEKQKSPYLKRIFKSNVTLQNTKSVLERNVFIKISPLLHVLQFITSNFECKPTLLPNDKYHYTQNYINNPNNEAYIDSFYSFLASKLTETGKAPCFPLFYGTFSAIAKEYKSDISEEYSLVKYNQDFQKNRDHVFNITEIDIDMSDDEEEEELSDDNFEEVNTNLENILELETLDDNNFTKNINNQNQNSDCNDSDNELSDNEDFNDPTIKSIDAKHSFEEILDNNNTFKYCCLKDFPVQLLISEQLEITLQDLIEETEISEEEWCSVLFQICFGLSVAQKNHDFVHNDLHVGNIMFKKTDIEYLYFKVNKKYFKIPTFGRITKIIDFGRATFKFNNNIYFSSVFDEDGDAEGQYDYPEENNFSNCKFKPNPSFDLCRLATTIVEHVTHESIFKLLNEWMTDKNGKNLIYEEDDFDLYINIARNVKNAVPKKQLNKTIFKRFNVLKKDISSLTFIYSL